jgi:histidinol dehydrogenase
MLTRRTPAEVTLEIKDPVDPNALIQSRAILEELRPSSSGGACSPDALLSIARRLGDIPLTTTNENDDEENSSSYIVPPSTCQDAFNSLTSDEKRSLINIHARVKLFAEAQRSSIVDMEINIPGGKAGQSVSPCAVAGCYAPGGRYPLPSSVIMTVVTARAAGCPYVVLCSPRPAPITLAAAHVAGADIVLRVGGAQAIGAMAYGVSAKTTGENGSTSIVQAKVPPCDVIVGPGNMWCWNPQGRIHTECTLT